MIPILPQRRRGFTLIELIVVITILLILIAATISLVNFSRDSEKVNGGARQVQSYLMGARDRAVHAGAPRGVRFVADPERQSIVTSLLFVGDSPLYSNGEIQLERSDPSSSRADIVAGKSSTFWWELYQRRNLFPFGQRIKIPAGRIGDWYTIVGFENSNGAWTGATPPRPNDVADQYPLKLLISPAFRDPANNPQGDRRAFSGEFPNTYELELPRQILPEQPAILPKGTVIDLLSSDVPATWPVRFVSDPDGDGVEFRNRRAGMDVMFSPRGSVIGSAASSGILHFYITKVTSTDLLEDYVDTAAVAIPVVPGDAIPVDRTLATSVAGVPLLEPIGDRAIVSVFTQTGAVSSHPVDPTDADEDRNGNGSLDAGEDKNNNGSLDFVNGYGIADDPYNFAETGRGLKQ